MALQVHGGYGYSSEFLPEAWLRDQKLNSLHEGTTGIQGIDLLGRKVVAEGGAALLLLQEEILATVARAQRAAIFPTLCERLAETMASVLPLTMQLASKGLQGDVEGMLLHSADYLQLLSIVVVSWQWLLQAAVAAEKLAAGTLATDMQTPERDFYEGKLCAAQYWLATELPRVPQLLALCQQGEDSYARMKPEWF